jgi:four helix bundle protein
MVTNFKDLIVYKKAHNLAMKIFEMSKKFPKEEKYSLTDQMRRSSRIMGKKVIHKGIRQQTYRFIR